MPTLPGTDIRGISPTTRKLFDLGEWLKPKPTKYPDVPEDIRSADALDAITARQGQQAASYVQEAPPIPEWQKIIDQLRNDIQRKYGPAQRRVNALYKKAPPEQVNPYLKDVIREELQKAPVSGRLVTASEQLFKKKGLVGEAARGAYPGTAMAAEMSKYVLAAKAASGIDLSKVTAGFMTKFGVPGNIAKAANYVTQGGQWAATFWGPAEFNAISEVSSGAEPTMDRLVYRPAFEAFKGLAMGVTANIPDTGLRIGSRVITRGAIDTLQKYGWKEKSWGEVGMMMATVGVLEALGLPKKTARLQAQSEWFNKIDPVIKSTMATDKFLKESLKQVMEGALSAGSSPEYQKFIKALMGDKVSKRSAEHILSRIKEAKAQGLNISDTLKNVKLVAEFEKTPGARALFEKTKALLAEERLTPAQKLALKMKADIAEIKGKKELKLGDLLKGKPKIETGKSIKELRGEIERAKELKKFITGTYPEHPNTEIIEATQRLYAKNYTSLTVTQAEILGKQLNELNTQGLAQQAATKGARISLYRRMINLWQDILTKSPGHKKRVSVLRFGEEARVAREKMKKILPESKADIIKKRSRNIYDQLIRGEIKPMIDPMTSQLIKPETIARQRIKAIEKEIMTKETIPGDLYRNPWEKTKDWLLNWQRKIDLLCAKGEGFTPRPGGLTKTCEGFKIDRVAEDMMRSKYIGADFLESLKNWGVNYKTLYKTRFITSKHNFDGNNAIAIFNAMGNKDAWNHVNKAYNFSVQDKNDLLMFMSTHPSLLKVANLIRDNFKETGPKLLQLLRNTQDREMKLNEWYTPIRVLNEYLQSNDKLNLSFYSILDTNNPANLHRGYQIERVHGAKQPMSLDAVGDYIKSMADVTHLLAFGPRAHMLQNTLTDHGVIEAYMRNPHCGKAWGDAMKSWLDRMYLDTENRITQDVGMKIAQMLRSGMSVSAIALDPMLGAKCSTTALLTMNDMGSPIPYIYEVAKMIKHPKLYNERAIRLMPELKDAYKTLDKDIADMYRMSGLFPLGKRYGIGKFKVDIGKLMSKKDTAVDKAIKVLPGWGDHLDRIPSAMAWYNQEYDRLIALGWAQKAAQKAAHDFAWAKTIKTKPIGLDLYQSKLTGSSDHWFRLVFGRFRSFYEMMLNLTERKYGEYLEDEITRGQLAMAYTTMFLAMPTLTGMMSWRAFKQPKRSVKESIIKYPGGMFPIINEFVGDALYGGSSIFMGGSFKKAVSAAKRDAWLDALYESGYSVGYLLGTPGIKPVGQIKKKLFNKKKK